MSQQNAESVRGVRIPLVPVPAGRRSLDQRLYVLFPVLYRRFAAAVTGLPLRSRLGRLVRARAVGMAYAAANRRDFDAVLVGFDREFEYRPSRDLLPPDMETVFRGRDGYLKVWRHWIDAFPDIRWDPEELIDFGDRLLVTTQQKGQGRGSGVVVSEPVFQLFILRRGLVLRQEDFLDRSKAFEAAGRP
jgi:ketosteroid isomerase-like protein